MDVNVWPEILLIFLPSILAYIVLMLLYEFQPEIDEHFRQQELKHWRRVYRRAKKREAKRNKKS